MVDSGSWWWIVIPDHGLWLQLLDLQYSLLLPRFYWTCSCLCVQLQATSIALLSTLGEGSLPCGSLWGLSPLSAVCTPPVASKGLVISQDDQWKPQHLILPFGDWNWNHQAYLASWSSAFDFLALVKDLSAHSGYPHTGYHYSLLQ